MMKRGAPWVCFYLCGDPSNSDTQIMMNLKKQLGGLVLFIAVASGTVWALFHFGGLRWQPSHESVNTSALGSAATNYSWSEAVERVKEARDDIGGGIVVPPELRHYSDRHWFLATQVAEVGKYNVQTCQDFVDLAGMIQRGEMVTVPSVTDTYVLYGVGEKADGGAFSRYQNERAIEIYNERQVADAYKRLSDTRSKLQTEIANLKRQSRAWSKRDRQKQVVLEKQITTLQQELKSTEEDKALMDESYGQPDSHKLFRDYELLESLGKNLAGRSFDIGKSSDRQAMKMIMLSALRPEALKIMEEVAAAYHRQFDRPLPVSSLVRPEQYQHSLSKVNRNAVLIETPPHSTGLAFDINYRYMSAAEQTFLMAELARLKNQGRIEAIRERGANYHVFAFISGTRPSDELIAGSLDKATLESPEAHHSERKAANLNSSPQKGRRPKSKTRRR